MEPIFATQANRLARHAPIGRVSRDPGQHADPPPVAPIQAVAATHPRPDHPPELLTVGPQSEANEGPDGLLHPTPR